MIFDNKTLIGEVFNNFISADTKEAIDNEFGLNCLQEEIVQGRLIQKGVFYKDVFMGENTYYPTNVHIMYMPSYYHNNKFWSGLIIQIMGAGTIEYRSLFRTIKLNDFLIQNGSIQRLDATSNNYFNKNLYEKLQIEAWNQPGITGFGIHLIVK